MMYTFTNGPNDIQEQNYQSPGEKIIIQYLKWRHWQEGIETKTKHKDRYIDYRMAKFKALEMF